MPIYSPVSMSTDGQRSLRASSDPGMCIVRCDRLATAVVVVMVVMAAAIIVIVANHGSPSTANNPETSKHVNASHPTNITGARDFIPSVDEVPKEIYFKINNMYNLLHDICSETDILEDSSPVKEDMKLPYLSVRRCKEELNPCPYDSFNSETLKLVVHKRKHKTVTINIKNVINNSTANLEVTFMEDEKCKCVDDNVWKKTPKEMMLSNDTVPCVHSVVHVMQDHRHTLNCSECSG